MSVVASPTPPVVPVWSPSGDARGAQRNPERENKPSGPARLCSADSSAGRGVERAGLRIRAVLAACCCLPRFRCVPFAAQAFVLRSGHRGRCSGSTEITGCHITTNEGDAGAARPRQMSRAVPVVA